MSAPAIELVGVTMTYARGRRSITALDGLSLAVHRGETFALMGANGAGKTTTLRIVAALLEPSAGSALVLGNDTVRRAGAVRELIGVSLGSERSFYWRMTARQNLVFFARLKGLRGPRIRHEVTCVSDEFGLSALLDAPVRKLSRGALARLSLARALLGDPGVLVLDEPLGSIDRAGGEVAWRAVERRAANGCAVLAATHSASLAGRCDAALALIAPGAR
jgi:ABC-2 type transport system ATP-binding protein